MKARSLTILAVSLLLCSTVLNDVPLPVNLTDAGATYHAQKRGPCTGFGGPWPSCGANGYLSFGNGTLPSDGFTVLSNFNTTSGVGEENFLTAFANFTGTAGGAGWTLVERPALDDLTYNINMFRTF